MTFIVTVSNIAQVLYRSDVTVSEVKILVKTYILAIIHAFPSILAKMLQYLTITHW